MRLSSWIFAGCCTALLGLLYLVGHDPFFWDTVQLASKHAHFFYENGLKWQALPAEIDSGHPPVFGYYLAGIWTVFGKSLPASHWAMAPFVFLNLWMLWRVGARLGNAWAPPLLVFADPVILTQHAMVAPDVLLLSGFLLALEGTWSRRSLVVTTGVWLLCLISMRGMMTAAALLIWQVYLLWSEGQLRLNVIWRKALPFIPGMACALLFLIWHYRESGWMGFHAGSPWAGAFRRVGPTGFFRNVAVLGWRWLDFGRVAEFGLLAYFIWLKRGGIIPFIREAFKENYGLLPLWLITTGMLSISALSYQNLSAHRYFIPAFTAFHLLILSRLVVLPARGRVLTCLLCLVMASGHLWIYPKGISNDWDCTLAHRSYHTLREGAMQFIDSQSIELNSVGTAFPCLNSGEMLSLNGDTRICGSKHIGQNAWILCSNVLNDFSERDFKWLEQHGRPVWHRQQGLVWMTIYDCR